MVTDSMGNILNVGDFVLANLRDYRKSTNSGSARKTVRATIKGFTPTGWLTLDVEGDVDGEHERSRLSPHHSTLIAPATMVEEYKAMLDFHTNEEEEGK